MGQLVSAAAESSQFTVRPVLRAAGLVFVLAFLLRLPSCLESLWVDELHTAWVIAEELSEVSGRAASGNQTPWYFWGLWCWEQVFGSSELALRLPSVLAVSLASSLLVWSGWRWTGHVSVGVLAGLFLAVERSSLFYGTEARCYAYVMVCVAGWLTSWIEYERRREGLAGQSVRSGGSGRFGSVWPSIAALGIWAGLAVLMHITAALVFVGLGLVVVGRSRWAVAGTFTGVGVAGVMSLASIGRVWNRREQWRAFGMADTVWDIVEMWPWFWMLGLPLAIGVMLLLVVGRRGRDAGWSRFESLAEIPFESRLWLCVIGVTAVVWAASYFDWVALWHRRYIVGLLPLVCLAGAVGWYRVLVWLGLRSVKVRMLAIAGVVLGLMLVQGQLENVLQFDNRLVKRQEEWRGVVSYLQNERQKDDDVWVAAQLIESPLLESEGEDEYLLFPVSGIYRVERAAALGPIDSSVTVARVKAWVGENRGSGKSLWIIVRRSRGGLVDWRDRLGAALSETERVVIELIPFKKLTLVRLSVAGVVLLASPIACGP